MPDNPSIPDLRLIRNSQVTPPPRAWGQLPTADPAARGRWRITGPAGSGVTSALVDTAVARVAAGKDPDGILMVTASKEAASRVRRELSARLLSVPSVSSVPSVPSGAGFVVGSSLVRSVHSLAFALLRKASGGEQVRLITGAEQDAVIRELLAGHAEDGGGSWPEEYRPALPLLGFARQLRDFLLRAVERGVSPHELQDLGVSAGRPMWVAAGDFLAEYQHVMRLSGRQSLSASELVTAALDRLDADPELIATQGWHTILVDDAQHLDPKSAELVERLLGHAELGVIGGDPNQAIFHFRGARPESLTDMPVDHEWELPETRRQPNRRVLVTATAGGERAVVADMIRRAHLIDGVPWPEIAVVVRSAGSIDAVRRHLLAAGIPVHISATDVVLSEQSIVSSVILGIRALSEPLSHEELSALALGPIGGADPITLRRLLRGLRGIDLETRAMDTLADFVIPGRGNAGEDELKNLAERLGPREMEVLTRLRDVLAKAGAARDARASVEEVLWELWQATGLADRLTGAALRGGAAGSQADRDLDAMMALFDAAGDFVERRPSASIDSFIRHIAEQELPTGVRDRRTAEPDAVTVLTAHGTVGRQWERVFVVGVQDDAWPSLGLTGTLFEQEAFLDLLDRDLDADVVVDRVVDRMQEERRLFEHVATTRATGQLILTAVDDLEGAEPQSPSRFLRDFEKQFGIEREDAEPAQPAQEADGGGVSGRFSLLTPPALVAELRRAVCAPSARADVKAQAARQLARLAAAGVPGADPAEWWATTRPSSSETLHRDPRHVTLSPSRIEAISLCPLYSVVERITQTEDTPLAMLRGTLVHAFAEAVENRAPVETAESLVQSAFESLLREPPWRTNLEIERFARLLSRTRDWLQAREAKGFELLATEAPVEVTVAATEKYKIAIRGRIDRIDTDGKDAYLIDFKTGKTYLSADEAQHNLQLTAYQLALATQDPEGSIGGAALVYPGALTKSVTVREQSAKTREELDEFRAMLPALADDIAGPRLRAQKNKNCETCKLRTLCPIQPEGSVTTHA